MTEFQLKLKFWYGIYQIKIQYKSNRHTKV